MLVRFVKRCLLASFLMVVFVVGTLAFCCALALTSPSFYATAVKKPIDCQEYQVALQEVKSMVETLEVFVSLDKSDFDALRELPENALAAMKEAAGQRHLERTAAIERLRNSPDVTFETFALTLTETQLNALVSNELDGVANDFRRPYFLLQDDQVLFAVTGITPAAEVVVSCGFEVATAGQSDLTFKLHGLKIGYLPMPLTTVLTWFLEMNPRLPDGLDLRIDDDRPMITFDALQNDGKLRVDKLEVKNGTLEVKNGTLEVLFRRNLDDIVAAK